MSCRLYFVRHGQSMGNLKNTYLGHSDLGLSPLGYEQARLVGDFLKEREIDKIYSSDLIRAYHTSLPLAEFKSIEPIRTELLREIFAGEWENRLFSELKEEFKESYGVWLNDIGNAHPHKGESVAELQERIVGEVRRIAEENDGKTVAVFTHATPIRVLFAYIRGKSREQIKDMPWASNASVSKASYSNGKFTEIYYGRDDFLSSFTSAFPKDV